MRGDYIRYERSGRFTVTCKQCTREIAKGLLRDGNYPAVVPNDHYREVTVVMREPDGHLSLHVDPMCQKCGGELSTLNLDAWWRAVVEGLARENHAAGRPAMETFRLLFSQARRSPVSVRAE